MYAKQPDNATCGIGIVTTTIKLMMSLAKSFDQLFLVMDGSGWVAGADGSRVTLSAGQGAFFENGARHSKGSESGMTALMVQVSSLRA